MSEQK